MPKSAALAAERLVVMAAASDATIALGGLCGMHGIVYINLSFVKCFVRSLLGIQTLGSCLIQNKTVFLVLK